MMKNIGLVTYYNSDNYGAMLQAYALQNEIKRNNCECIIISHDRFSSRNIEQSSGSRSKKIIKLLTFAFRYPRSIRYTILSFSKKIRSGRNTCKNKCAAFRDEYFPNKTIDFYYSTEQIMNNPPIFDGYVCGSDQIWNPERFTGAAPFYLDFVPEGRNRIAYAPSLAMTSIPENLYSQYKALLSKFTDVSVRENRGCEAVKKATGISPTWVLDPTFLMSKDEWIKFENDNVDTPGRYIFCYFLSKENALHARNTINAISKKMNAEVVVLPFGIHTIDKNWHSLDSAGPREFVALIHKAEYILTDSFHGTAISINLEKPFNVFSEDTNASFANRFDRILNILNICGLQHKTFTNVSDLDTSAIDYIKVDEALLAMRETSKSFLSSALKKVSEHKKQKSGVSKTPILASYESCTGCSACYSVCNNGALVMKADSAGFWRPTINRDLCLNCGLCMKKCPVISPLSLVEDNEEFFALYAKNDEVRKKGSSGNAFGLGAMSVIESDGIVFGAALSSDCKTLKMSSSDEVGLERLQKSKYFEADMSNVVVQIKEALSLGREVMFTGTPCQAAAIRSVFGNNTKLVICDFLCHGVPSAEWYNRYLREMENKYNSKAEEVLFRSKAFGWRLYCMKIVFENGKQYLKTRYSDPYFIDFFKNSHLRTSCYSCNRIAHSAADITFGDYWAVQRNGNIFDDDTGISVIALRTKRGKDFFNTHLAFNNAFIQSLSQEDMAGTFISRSRKKPSDNDVLPDRFIMHPDLSIKEKIYKFYAELILRHTCK